MAGEKLNVGDHVDRRPFCPACKRVQRDRNATKCEYCGWGTERSSADDVVIDLQETEDPKTGEVLFREKKESVRDALPETPAPTSQRPPDQEGPPPKQDLSLPTVSKLQIMVDPDEFQGLKDQLEEAKGKLDIIVREMQGDHPADLAADYGGTDWENSPEVQAVRRERAHMEAIHEDFRRKHRPLVTFVGRKELGLDDPELVNTVTEAIKKRIDEEWCLRCRGTGEVEKYAGGGFMGTAPKVECPDCKGTGWRKKKT